MRKIILIGNGFDLAHGMETSYVHFIEWYLKNVINKFAWGTEYKGSMINLKSEVGNPYIKESFSIDLFFKYLEENSIEIAYVSNFIKKVILNAKNYKWVDIERIYFEGIVKLYKELETIHLGNYHTIEDELKKYNNSFDLLKLELIEYLVKVNEKEKTVNQEIREHIELIAKIGDTPKEKNIICVLNFNYTNTIDIYKDVFKDMNCIPINIHGDINNKANPIIFGYGDETDAYYEKIEQINYNEFLRNFKSFFYLKTNKYRELDSVVSIKSDYEIHIMGHSCGLSDRILLSSIFDNPYCKNIYIYYHQKSETENDYFEKTIEISRHFKPENKSRMRTVIVPEEQCKPLVSFKE
jgi:hypothetical protein